MKIYPLKAFLPITDKIENPHTFINNIKDNFNHQLVNGFYSCFNTPSYYIYSIVLPHKTSYGLVTLVSVETIDNGNVVPHEETLENK